MLPSNTPSRIFLGLEPFIGVEVSENIKAAIRVDTSYQEILKVVGTITRKDVSHLPAGHPAKELASIWGLVSKAKTGEDDDSVEVILIDSSRLYMVQQPREEQCWKFCIVLIRASTELCLMRSVSSIGEA